MEKIYQWCSKNIDKIAHFAVCVILCYIVADIDINWWHRDIAVGLAIGAIATALVGLLKEIIDFFHNHGFCVEDLLADILGAFLAVVLYLAVHLVHLNV